MDASVFNSVSRDSNAEASPSCRRHFGQRLPKEFSSSVAPHSAQILAAKPEVEPDSEVTIAAEVQATATASATPQPETKKQGKWSWLMMIGGGGLAVAALFPFLRKWYHDPSWLKTLLKGGDRSSFGQE